MDYIDKDCFDFDKLKMAEEKQVSWIVQDILPSGLALLAGKPRAGKSYLAADLAVSVANGTPFLGFPTSPGKVVYLSLEDSDVLLWKHIQASANTSIVSNFRYRLDFPRGAEAIEKLKMYIECQPQLIVVDIVGCILPYVSIDQSNRYDFISKAFEQFKIILKESTTCLLLIHHAGKRNYDDTQDKVLGSTAYQAKSDTIWILEKKDNTHRLTIESKFMDGNKELLLSRLENGNFSQIETSEKPITDTEKILKIINDSTQPLSPQTIATILKKNITTVTQLLHNLFNQKRVTKLG